jgi:hypothetical protein
VTKTATAFVVLLALVLAVSALAGRGSGISLGYFSEQAGPAEAIVGTNIKISRRQPGTSGKRGGNPARVRHTAPGQDKLVGGAGNDPFPGYPSLAAGSPLLLNPQPRGQSTFWYSDGSGHSCIYVAIGNPLCYVVTGPSRAATPALSPAVIAASISGRLDLIPGRIKASPQVAGLTGTASWFWLDPAPGVETVSLALGGEQVTVTAVPSISWRFGDGAAVVGGAGVPYQPGPPPPEAVVHAYETRCLPGDQGRNPYVLVSCQQDGYQVQAVVSWRISYEASGVIDEAGSVTPRTTEAGTGYPVSEARAFLVSGGSP